MQRGPFCGHLLRPLLHLGRDTLLAPRKHGLGRPCFKQYDERLAP